MKNKLVVWGTNEAEEKVLIALELQAESNKVMLYTFSEAIATDVFVNKMMNEWREGKPVEFPEGHTSLERELSVTENLLPEGLKTTERGDLLQRAQTEWHFAVLSSKLHAAYQQELADFQEKVRSLGSYDAGMWDSLKAFWDKVQGQSRDRNIYRDHADNLRDGINALFEDLKKLRAKVQSELVAASAGVYEEFNKVLDDIDARIIAGGFKINTVFDELKAMQRRYRDARMSNEHRNKIWDRLDGAFKAAKERKFGPSANEGTVTDRHDRRLSGLQDALKRMQDSVRRDDEELNFQRKKVNSTEGQLEAQIRMAKIKMIEERVSSKREKVEEMSKTLNDVQRQAGSAKEKEAKRSEKEAERQKFNVAKEKAKSEIAAGIRTRDGEGAGTKDDSLFEAAGTMIGDVLMDALDTIKAVASVAAEKAGDAFADVVERVENAADAFTKKEETPEPAEAPVAETEVEPAPESEAAPAAVAVEATEEAPTAEEEAPVPESEVAPAVVVEATEEAPTAEEAPVVEEAPAAEEVAEETSAVAEAETNVEDEDQPKRKASKKKAEAETETELEVEA